MIDSGDIVIKSGQDGHGQGGHPALGRLGRPGRMDNLLSANYTDAQVHGVLSPYDGLSIGIISSLKGVGYGSGDLKMPIVSGQDAEVPSVKAILRGEQYRRSSRTRANSPASPSAWSMRCFPADSRRSMTPRPTTTA